MEVDPPAAPSVGSIYNYVVTAHKPTAVVKSVVGNFTSANETNLIIAKSTRIEVHTLSADGLQSVLDMPLYGRVTGMELFRPKGSSRDRLFVLVEKLKFFVIEYDSATGTVVTRAKGDVRDAIGNPADNGQLAFIDPEGRAVGLHLYDGMLKVIPIDDQGSFGEAFNVRLEELSVVSMVFLEGCARPTVALLYEDAKHARSVKTYEVVVREKELAEGPWSQQHLDPGACLLFAVPAPLGGAIVVGESTISYLSGTHPPRAAAIKATIMKAYGRIDEDGSRYLLGDYLGNLYLLVVAHDGQRVAGLKVEIVGHTSVPSSLSYLDNGFVFVGSRQGDSQLVRLHAEPLTPTDPNNYVEVLESYVNLGPIVDFTVVDLERQGQGQVVTCSGAMGDGSVRVIRNGIGINEQATVELPGIKGVWSLRQSWMDAYDRHLVLTFVGETRVLALNEDDELDEAEVPGFDAGAQTLYCGNTQYDQLVQVTSTSVRLVHATSHQLLGSWQPPAGSNIINAAGAPSQVVVATSGGHLVYLEVVEGQGLVERGRAETGAEVACVDITPVGPPTSDPSCPAPSTLLVVGTWSMQLRLLSLPGLQEVCREELGGDMIPRSVLLNTFEGVPYCLCGLGDGQLYSWKLDPPSGSLSERRRVMLGTKPIMLRTFRSGGTTNAFAASDRPTIIYSTNKKLVFSNLNENEVNFMTSFNSASFPDSLAIAKESALTIGTVDEIQKLHVRTVPLGEQPRRIAHQESTKTFGVVTIAGSTIDDEQFWVRILDDQTLDTLASYALEPQELPCSITSTALGGDKAMYYVVGTAYARPEEAEPTKGRLLVLQYSGEGKLHLVAEKEVKGAAYEVTSFQGKLLSAVNNKVQLHRWVLRDDGARELNIECSMLSNVVALYLAARGDFIVVGDMMRSMSLLMYKPEEGTLEMRAQDFNSSWTTAVSMLDDDTYLAADTSYNLYVVRKNSDAATDEERNRLDVVGEYHVGELINRFRHGSLVMKLPDSDISSVPTLLYGSVDGAIGLLATLPQPLFDFLHKLQDALRQVVKGIGGLDHASWRSFANERKSSESRGFVDGDLIELFLDLPPEKQQEVAAHMGEVSVEEITKKVEEIARLH